MKAFEKVQIESVFTQRDILHKRTFEFTLSEGGVKDHSISNIESEKRATMVRLLGYKEPYKKECRKKPETIAARIIEHCVVYFLSDSCPRIRLIDGGNEILLNDMFNDQIKKYGLPDKIPIGSHEFKIIHLRLYQSDDNRHKIHYLANNREVNHDFLDNDIPDLNKKLKDDEGKPFIYLAYVASDYLDKSVNTERTNFDLPEENMELFKDDIHKGNLKDSIIKKVKEHLKPLLDIIRDEKVKYIETYIHDEAPQYRPLLKYAKDDINEIKDAKNKINLEIELHKIQSKFEREIKNESKRLLNMKSVKVQDIYLEMYKVLIEKINDFGKSKLAEYIIHRKTMLEILKNNLSYDENVKYN